MIISRTPPDNPVAAESNVKQDSATEIPLEKGEIVGTPVAEQHYTLDDLLTKVTNNNIHDEADTGERFGKETW